MHSYRYWKGLPPEARGASVTIGNFDGIHKGHRALIDAARKACKDSPLGVITFEPHPRQFFAPDSPPFRLMNSESRRHRLERLDIDLLYELPFDATLAAMTPEAFVTEILVEGLGISHITIGEDFRFGAKRGGDAQMLVRMGEELGYGVTVLPLIGDSGAQKYSSTAIRDALTEGRPEDAAEVLGHWHRIDGPVIHGAKRGRELGFPTANMSLAGLHLPRLGVYAVLVDILTGPFAGETHRGAASIGVRPTFEADTAANLETFILDFSGDLYGQQLSVALVEWIRPELAFDGIDSLIEQMHLDVETVRKILG